MPNGVTDDDLDIFASGIVEVYDPTTNKWATRTSMPAGRNFLSAAALNGKLYAMGGLVDTGVIPNRDTPASHTLFSYDPKTDQWRQRRDMLVARYGAAASPLDGQIYVVGGREFAESTELEMTEEYTP